MLPAALSKQVAGAARGHVLVHETPPILYATVGQRQLMSSLRGTLRRGLALPNLPLCGKGGLLNGDVADEPGQGV